MADEATATTVETTETPAATVTVTPTDDVAGLKSALEKERTAARDGKQAAKERDALKAELDKFREASQSEQDKALNAAKVEAAKETRDGLMGQVTRSLVEANVRAAAGGRLADPEDAVRLLDLSDFELDDKFNIDPTKVAKAIEDLLAAKPYLAGTDPKPRGSFDLGARPTTPEAQADAEYERYFPSPPKR